MEDPFPNSKSLTTMAIATATQYQAVQKGGSFILVSIPKPNPGPNEVSIRLKAIVLNLLDWKGLCFSFVIKSWLAVLGINGTGIVKDIK